MAMTGASASPPVLPAALQEAIDQYRAWSGRHLQAEQDASSITAPLYHYTDGHGLKGILQSGQIWFTDYRYLNDPSELTHGADKARDVARQIVNEADGLARLFFQNLADVFTPRNFEANLEFFIASFSHARNDLGQWRAYSDDGRGFAIGFAPRMFSIVDPVPDRLPEFVGPIRYRTDEVCRRHKAALDQAMAIFLETVNVNADLMCNKAVRNPFMDQFMREIMAQPLIWNCLTSKHPAYEHEQEVRLVIMGVPERLSAHVRTRLRESDCALHCPSYAVARTTSHY